MSIPYTKTLLQVQYCPLSSPQPATASVFAASRQMPLTSPQVKWIRPLLGIKCGSEQCQKYGTGSEMIIKLRRPGLAFFRNFSYVRQLASSCEQMSKLRRAPWQTLSNFKGLKNKNRTWIKLIKDKIFKM